MWGAYEIIDGLEYMSKMKISPAKGGATTQNCLKTTHDLFDKHKYRRPRVGFAGTTGHPKFPKDSIISSTFSSKFFRLYRLALLLHRGDYKSITHHFLVVGLQENDGSVHWA